MLAVGKDVEYEFYCLREDYMPALMGWVWWLRHILVFFLSLSQAWHLSNYYEILICLTTVLCNLLNKSVESVANNFPKVKMKLRKSHPKPWSPWKVWKCKHGQSINFLGHLHFWCRLYLWVRSSLFLGYLNIICHLYF